MSYYPSYRNTGNLFNDNNIISLEDTSGGGITTISLDTSKLVEKENPVINDTLYIKKPNTGLNFYGDLQLSAFNETLKSNLIDNTNNLTKIKYDGSKTLINDDLDLSNSNLLNIKEEHIPQSKIINLETRLQGIDDNLNNINNNDVDITNIQTKNQQQDDKMDLTDTTINNHITTYNNYTTQNDLDKTNINLNVLALEDKNTEQDLNLLNHTNNYNSYTTQNNTDKLNINNSITSIENHNVNQDDEINTTNTNLTNHTNNYNSYTTQNDIDKSNINLSITSIENKNTEQDLNLTNHINNYSLYTTGNDTNLSNLNSSITNLENEDIGIKNRVDDLELYDDNQTALNTSNLNRLSILETQQTTNTSNIALKQAIINDVSKLNTVYIGNGDVSNNKFSSLNDVRTDITIQTQLDVMKNELDLFDGSNVVNNTNRISILESEILTKEDIINDTNKIEISNVNLLQDNLNTINTNLTNNDNSISTINTNLNSLTNADEIHDTQITNLQNQDILLQNNINLKQNIISLTNKLITTKIFDTGLNESLNNILETIDGNINTLNLNKQNKIDILNKLDSSLLDLSTSPLQYIDITSNLKVQLTNITSAINTLQNLTTNDTITTFQDIEDNFETLETTKLNKSVYDDTISPEIININNAISTLQGLQNGDIISFQNINNSITNLTNTKNPLIDVNNKLNTSLLNRDDNLQFMDVSSSIQTKLNSLDNELNLKNDIIDVNNKLSISNVNISGSNIQYADYPSSITTKLNSLDSQITILTNNDVSQSTTNTNFTNSINTNSTNITDLANGKQDTIDVNNKMSISNVDLTGSSLSYVDINSGLQTSLNNLQSNIENIDLTSKQDTIDVNNKVNVSNVDLTGSALSYVDINSSLTGSLDTLTTNINTLNSYNVTQTGINTTVATDITNLHNQITGLSTGTQLFNVEDMFEELNYGVNLPIAADSSTDMTFQIAGEDYRIRQGSYNGVYDVNLVQTGAHTAQNMFVESGNWKYQGGYWNSYFYNDEGNRVKFNTPQYDAITGFYIGTAHSTTTTDATVYEGDFLEFHQPFYFTPNTFNWECSSLTSMPLKSWLFGSNDGVDYVLIKELINDNSSLSISHTITTTEKYKILKWVVSEITPNTFGYFITNMTMGGTAYSSLILSTQDQIDAIDLSGITTNATNITANSDAIASIDLSGITTNATNITANSDAIASIDLSGITTNATNITAINDTIASIDLFSKTEPIDTNLVYNLSTNTLTHNYNEKTLYINPLDDFLLMTCDLTINTPTNNTNYVQKVLVNCLEFKSYINTLNINGETVEIKYKDGDTNINLAPISGYSMIIQSFDILRENDVWLVMSSIKLFYNSFSNTTYDATPPTLTLLGDAVMNLQINTTYNEPGYTASDLLDGDLYSSVVITSNLNMSLVGAYSIVYDVEDGAHNTVSKTRIVNVFDDIAPVVVLLGDAEVSVNLNGSYTELGATATDNSNETMTVVITGAVDETTVGDYVITYTATDSNSNTHFVTRLVHVAINYILQYSNPTTDIIQYADLYAQFPVDMSATTNFPFTITGNANTYLNGNYNLEHSMYQSTNYEAKEIFNPATNKHWTQYTGGYNYTSHIFGPVSKIGYSSPYNGSNVYVGWTDENAKFIYHSVNAGGTDYPGLYQEMTFAFYIEVNKIGTMNIGAWGGTNIMSLLGKHDNGDYEFIATLTVPQLNTNILHEQVITTTTKFKTFRFVYTKPFLKTCITRQIALYGDIYTS